MHYLLDVEKLEVINILCIENNAGAGWSSIGSWMFDFDWYCVISACVCWRGVNSSAICFVGQKRFMEKVCSVYSCNVAASFRWERIFCCREKSITCSLVLSTRSQGYPMTKKWKRYPWPACFSWKYDRSPDQYCQIWYRWQQQNCKQLYPWPD